MEKYTEILKKCSLFEGTKEEELLKMLNCLGAKTESFDKKYTIFSEGSPATYIAVVLSGSVQLTRVDYYGNRSIISNVEAPGVFGEAFACAELERMPVVVSANEKTELMLIDRKRVLHTCCNNCSFHQRLIFNIMKDLSRKNIELYQRAEITSKRSTREKLIAYLLFTAKKENSRSFTIPFNRQELADYLEVERSGLSMEIAKLRKEGFLESHKSSFRLL